MKEPCLIFLHLPKTGGSTLTTVLRWQYRNLLPSEMARLTDAHETLEQLPIGERTNLSVLMGHFPYGIHVHVPKACNYITIVREPAQRVLSVYRHVLSAPLHPLHERVVSSSMSLDDYVRSGIHHYQTENALTRQLAGRDEEGEVTTRDLNVASTNLKTFVAVGLTEAFDESMILFKRVLGWSHPFYFSRNVSKKEKRTTRVSDKTLDFIRERNAFDIEIYGQACSLFSSLIEHHGEGFDRELSRFRLLNRAPQAFGSLLDPIAPRIRRTLERRAMRRSHSHTLGS